MKLAVAAIALALSSTSFGGNLYDKCSAINSSKYEIEFCLNDIRDKAKAAVQKKAEELAQKMKGEYQGDELAKMFVREQMQFEDYLEKHCNLRATYIAGLGTGMSAVYTECETELLQERLATLSNTISER